MAPGRVWLLLALLAGHGARPGRAGQCQDGELRTLWGGGTKCCPKCTWKGESPTACQAAQDRDCKCPQGHGCATEPCLFCRRLPQCQPGWELGRRGLVDFEFECKRCRNGTYSSSRNSWCRNWTDCESSGFVTLREGNSTHNAVCSLPARAPEPARVAPGLPSSAVLAVLVAVALFVLVLLSFLLHFCIWSLRGHRDRDSHSKLRHGGADSLPTFPRLLLQGEESYSIQFPEEEHGDKSEDRDRDKERVASSKPGFGIVTFTRKLGDPPLNPNILKSRNIGRAPFNSVLVPIDSIGIFGDFNGISLFSPPFLAPGCAQLPPSSPSSRQPWICPDWLDWL
ncbi:tumor necrosis factor receptor superfamily member 18 isoform X2 [Passer domesticus]|uniref:tumor necrosis factor receptor superfamily member 18 isoform X2 n=1 Tax=Passer domesticus TaxID=48849 RepID=UPI0030FF1EBA